MTDLPEGAVMHQRKPEDETREQRAQQEKRTERIVFDDPLSAVSEDDTDQGWGDQRASAAGSGERGLDWYLSERPPHHGD